MKPVDYIRNQIWFMKDNDLQMPEFLMFGAILIAAKEQREVNVTDLMKIYGVNSPASNHRYITSLLSKDMIEFKHKGRDRRTKYVLPTRTGLKKFTATFGE